MPIISYLVFSMMRKFSDFFFRAKKLTGLLRTFEYKSHLIRQFSLRHWKEKVTKDLNLTFIDTFTVSCNSAFDRTVLGPWFQHKLCQMVHHSSVHRNRNQMLILSKSQKIKNFWNYWCDLLANLCMTGKSLVTKSVQGVQFVQFVK